MPALTLQAWAERCTAPAARLHLHPTFIGDRRRSDAWHNTAWLPREGHHVLFLVDEGWCTICRDAQQQRFGPGACFILHPRFGPEVQFSQRIRFHECYIKITEKKHEPELSRPLLAIEQAWDLIPAIDALALYCQQDPQSLLLRYSVAQLLLRFDVMHQEQAGGIRGLSTAQCNKIISWTRQHIEHQPEPRDIAQLLDLTPDYCARVFKQRFGLSLRDWLIGERIQEAARRLRDSGDSIEAVGESLGFSNAAHFSRQFKRHMRCTPSAWRSR